MKNQNTNESETPAAVAGAAPCSATPLCIFCAQTAYVHLQGVDLCNEHATYYAEHIEEFINDLNDQIAKRN